MIQRTRLRLTVLNAVVLLLIFTLLNVSIYLNMRHSLYGKVDSTARKAAESIVLKSDSYIYRVPGLDRPILVLLWDKNRNPMEPFPHLAADDHLVQYRKALESGTQTIVSQDRIFRAITLPKIDALSTDPYLSHGISLNEIGSVQLLVSVDQEETMLQQLKIILWTGQIAGMIAAVLAGYFLAGRALLPIRRSWVKQQRFVADASHELRTPLAVLRLHAELLLRHPERNIIDESDNIAVILQESKRMGMLLESLLTLARSDSNQLELNSKVFPLENVVRQAGKAFEQLASLKDIRFEMSVGERLPVNGDEERLHQLLVILLDNALNFTPSGGKVRLDCKRQDHLVSITIEDTGIGISEKQIPHIFERFYRGDQARSRQKGGSGLGLSIAKWIVDKHGGAIRVESKQEAGTRMTVTLPVSNA